jgi:urease accessory protein
LANSWLSGSRIGNIFEITGIDGDGLSVLASKPVLNGTNEIFEIVMNKNAVKRLVVPSFLLLVPSLASAHIVPGTSHGLQDGLMHPLTGWDHLLAMIAVGLWAAQQRGRALWQIPTAFVSIMALGGILGLAGVYMPGAELAIAISVLALGALIATKTSFAPSASMMLVGAFALFHGYAHGHEMPASASALAFSAGFVISTIALHGLGLAAGLSMRNQPRAIRFAGATIAACGLCLLV